MFEWLNAFTKANARPAIVQGLAMVDKLHISGTHTTIDIKLKFHRFCQYALRTNVMILYRL